MDKCFKNENLKFVNSPYKLKFQTVLKGLNTNTEGQEQNEKNWKK